MAPLSKRICLRPLVSNMINNDEVFLVMVSPLFSIDSTNNYGADERWAVGDVGQEYVLAYYSRRADADRLVQLLCATRPVIEGYVTLEVVRMPFELFPDYIHQLVQHMDHAPDLFYPESLHNYPSGSNTPLSLSQVETWVS